MVIGVLFCLGRFLISFRADFLGDRQVVQQEPRQCSIFLLNLWEGRFFPLSLPSKAVTVADSCLPPG